MDLTPPVETDLSGSGQVKRQPLGPQDSECSGRSLVRGRGNPSVTGATRLGSADSLGDFRDSGGKPGSGELIGNGRGPAREPG